VDGSGAWLVVVWADREPARTIETVVNFINNEEKNIDIYFRIVTADIFMVVLFGFMSIIVQDKH
jgi:hypothetical protein